MRLTARLEYCPLNRYINGESCFNASVWRSNNQGRSSNETSVTAAITFFLK